MQFGLERFLEDPALRAPLKGRRVALLAHPASVTRDLTHSLDALAALPDVKLSAAFGPQHGLRGDQVGLVVVDDEDPGRRVGRRGAHARVPGVDPRGLRRLTQVRSTAISSSFSTGLDR